MAETYKRAVFVGPKTIRFDELPIPKPGPNQALVKVKACALCTWEQRSYTGEEALLPAIQRARSVGRVDPGRQQDLYQGAGRRPGCCLDADSLWLLRFVSPGHGQYLRQQSQGVWGS